MKVVFSGYDKETGTLKIQIYHSGFSRPLLYSFSKEDSPEQIYENFLLVVEDFYDTKQLEKDKLVRFFEECKKKALYSKDDMSGNLWEKPLSIEI